MFENLISQSAAGLLMDDISSGRLPPSILFYGPPAEGKMTAALELARALSCRSGNAPWACDCRDCALHRSLTHPDLAITGPRDCILEIRASAAALLASRAPGAPGGIPRKTAARFLFARSIRKLTARFSPELNDGDDARLARAMPLLASIAETLEEFETMVDADDCDADSLGKTVSTLVESAAKLEDDFLPDGVPVNVIRNAASWARLTPYGRKKVLIVENADRMQDSARNAFLKILEEPPRDAVFILTTSRRGAIIPTILSRVRTYAFVERQAKDREEVVSRVFRDTLPPGESLSGYFDRFLPVSPEAIRAGARAFLSLVLSEALDASLAPLVSLPSALEAAFAVPGNAAPARDSTTIPSVVSSLNKCKPAKVWRLFLTEIMAVLSASVRTGQVSARESLVYASWLESVRVAQTSVDILNISPTQALERLSYEMKEAL